MRGPSPLYIEERHRALGRDATFSWSRALTHPPRCNRTRHRGRHLVSDFVGAAILVSWGPPSWTGSRGGRHLGSDVVGAAILDRKCGGRHLGSDVVTSLTLNRRLYYFWGIEGKLDLWDTFWHDWNAISVCIFSEFEYWSLVYQQWVIDFRIFKHEINVRKNANLLSLGVLLF